MLCLVVSGAVCQEAPSISLPVAYPAERYEAGWNKNPFTLKTMPVVAAQDSFAKDLAIAAYYGDSEDPTVVVVNTKTGERTRLKKSHAAANGMQLKSVTLGSGRKDMAAEVTLGSETSELHFNDEYTKQIAAAETVKSPQGQPPVARQVGVPGMPAAGQPPKPAGPGKAPATTPARLPVPAKGKTVASTAGSSTPTAANAMKKPWVAPPAPPAVVPSVATGGSPVSVRRRLIAPPAMAPAASIPGMR